MRSPLTPGTFAVCIALASTPAAADDWQPIPAKADLDYLVSSVHRIETHVYLVARGTMNTPQGSAKYETPIEFDCPQHAFRMSWADVSTMGNPPARFYGKTVGHYAPTQFVSASASRYGEALLQWACHLPNQPERLVNVARSGDNKLTQVDSHSISRSGKLTSLWTRYDYPQLQFDPPYDAPYDSKREFVTVNCETNRYRILVGYDFTADGTMTDNMIARDDAETPLDSSDDYEVALKAVACGKPVDPETYVGIGGETQRAKAPLPTNVDIEDVPATNAVVAKAREFSAILPARSSFKSARIVETMTTGTRTSHIEVIIQPSTDGVLRAREIYSPDFFVDRDMLGLVQLKSKMNSARSESRSVYITQALTVNANAWKEGGEVSFLTEGVNVPGQGKPQQAGMKCQIGQRVDASIVNEGLAGQAWSLECTRPNNDSFKAYYIESLGYLLTTREKSRDFGDSDTTVDSISIER
ncbi:surface-adhesin E family protein [Paraburkholderia bannensis]|uniref:surface-adhesin E family protein n=1 Tax=Paraburkholderia bannensis TaxID=765414 RepID=UPI002ABE8232|nr:surface-adhesin E family protein [Paraburkholderia bannensis]